MKEVLSAVTKRRLAMLDALEAGGVDNWDWYGESLESLDGVEFTDDIQTNNLPNVRELAAAVESLWVSSSGEPEADEHLKKLLTYISITHPEGQEIRTTPHPVTLEAKKKNKEDFNAVLNAAVDYIESYPIAGHTAFYNGRYNTVQRLISDLEDLEM